MMKKKNGRVGLSLVACSIALLLVAWMGAGRRADFRNPAFPVNGTGDVSGPLGTWYLNANNFLLAATITAGSQPETYQGTLINERGTSEPLDNISWDGSARRLEFRRNGSGFWQWYRGTVVEGVLVGRFSHSAQSPTRPAQLTSYASHVTGWNSDYLDQDVVPRVYEVILNRDYRARLRIDYASDGASLYAGRLKVYSTVSGGARGEDVEYDLEVTQWDGTNLRFIRRNPAWTQTYTGVATGRTISGTFTQTGVPGSFSWNGMRAEVLSYGFAGKSADDRAAWQARTRRQLYHLLMAGNPALLTRNVTVLRANVPPTPSRQFPADRDDDPADWPPEYQLTELQFDYTLPNPYGGPALPRRSHAYLAVPNAPPPSGGYPAVLAVNGHGGSAAKMMNPDDVYFWYGDFFARRGAVVMAVDISHRPAGDRRGLYGGYDAGDDPANGNGTHPAIKAPGFDSDWEEDGERTWDALRALDHLVSLPYVDATRVLVTGISMGGEITTWAGALDPRLALSIPAGYSPDMGVMIYNGNHPCWRWLNADVREYVDISDLHALTAPRPLIVETGKVDFTFSAFRPPFAADKQVARRARAAYGDEVANFVHYLHYDQHHYHVGDVNPTRPTEPGVRVPNVIEPEAPWSLLWQTDDATSTDGSTLWDYVASFLGL